MGRDHEKKYKETWEKEDKFIQTDYNQKIMRALEKLLKEDDLFDENNWNAAKDKEAYIRSMIDRLNGIFGTNLKDVRFSDPTGEVTLGWLNSDSLNQLTFACYYNKHDIIAINSANINTLSFPELVSTLCHEMRHNMQCEIVNLKDDELLKLVGPEDYEKINDYRKEAWKKGWENPLSGAPDEAVKQQRREEFRRYAREANIDPSSYSQNAITEYEMGPEYYKYIKQQHEVDARYVQDMAKEWLEQRASVGAPAAEAAIHAVETMTAPEIGAGIAAAGATATVAKAEIGTGAAAAGADAAMTVAGL